MPAKYILAWAALLWLVWAQPAAAWDYRLFDRLDLDQSSSPVWDLRYSSDGRYLATLWADGRLILYGPERKRLWEYRVDLSPTSRLAFAAADKYLAVSAAGESRTVLILAPETQRGVQELKAHSQPLTALAFSPATDLLVTAGWDETLKVWEWHGLGFRLRQTVVLPAAVLAMAFDAEGFRLATAGADKKLTVWQWAGGRLEPARQTALAGRAADLAWGPGGAYLAAGGEDGTLTLWHLSADALRQVQAAPAHSQRINSLAFGPGRLLATASWDETVRIWRVRPDRLHLRQTLPAEGAVHRVAFDPAGKFLLEGGESKRLRLWQLVPCLLFFCR